MRINICWENKPPCYHKDNRTSKEGFTGGSNLDECRRATNDIEWEILEACQTVEKLMIIEAIYFSKLKPALKTRDEYRGRQLTLKY